MIEFDLKNPDTQRVELLAKPLLEWFRGHARILPWRENPLPYRVWISEIMLQQTRVEAVKPYYERFMEALPEMQDLAACEEIRLLKLWEGLGYYNRARNLKKAAEMVMEVYEGRMPDQYEELQKLPGIGSYTAGAIASIAFGQPVPAVDGNVLRVIARITGDGEDILKASMKKKIEEALRPVIPKDHAGAFNQGLMEIGAMVCVPNGAPHCEDCPFSEFCLTRIHNLSQILPYKAPKARRSIEEKTILILKSGYLVGIRKRQETGLLAGMYELPNVEGHFTEEEAIAWVKDQGLHPIRIQKLEDSKHIFTHKEWHMQGYIIRIEDLDEARAGDLVFIDPEATLIDYPIPSAFAAYTKYLKMILGVTEHPT